MNITYHKSYSGGYPELLDTTSSHTSVYIRKNVKEIQIPDPFNEGQTRTEYEYDEAILSKQEYEMLQIQLDAEQAIAELAEVVFAAQ